MKRILWGICWWILCAAGGTAVVHAAEPAASTDTKTALKQTALHAAPMYRETAEIPAENEGWSEWLQARQGRLMKGQHIIVTPWNETMTKVVLKLKRISGDSSEKESPVESTIREYAESGFLPPLDSVMKKSWETWFRQAKWYRVEWESADGYRTADMGVLTIPLKSLQSDTTPLAAAFWQTAFQPIASEAEKRYLNSRPQTGTRFAEMATERIKRTSEQRRMREFREMVELVQHLSIHYRGRIADLQRLQPEVRVSWLFPLSRCRQGKEVYYAQDVRFVERSQWGYPVRYVTHIWKHDDKVTVVWTIFSSEGLYRLPGSWQKGEQV